MKRSTRQSSCGSAVRLPGSDRSRRHARGAFVLRQQALLDGDAGLAPARASDSPGDRGRDWLWGSLLSLVVFPGMLALAVMFIRAPFNWIFGSLFLALAGWSLFGLAEYFVARFEVRPEGLAFRASYGGEGVAPWGAVARIRYVWRLQWFVLELRDARSVRVVACALDHTPELAHALLQRCQATEVDDVTREFLARIALGHPPSVWRFEPYP